VRRFNINYDATSKGATNYLHLAQEVIKKTANNTSIKAIKKQALADYLPY
jgi:hypothetical protein